MAQFEEKDIEFPDWLKKLGFEDQSYRNDLAARAGRNLDATQDLICWVKEDNPYERECETDPKYYVETVMVDETEPLREVYSGDDAAAAEAAIRGLLHV